MTDYSNGVSGVVLQHRVLHECDTRLDAIDTTTHRPTADKITLPSLSSSINCEGSDEGRVGEVLRLGDDHPSPYLNMMEVKIK